MLILTFQQPHWLVSGPLAWVIREVLFRRSPTTPTRFQGAGSQIAFAKWATGNQKRDVYKRKGSKLMDVYICLHFIASRRPFINFTQYPNPSVGQRSLVPRLDWILKVIGVLEASFDTFGSLGCGYNSYLKTTSTCGRALVARKVPCIVFHLLLTSSSWLVFKTHTRVRIVHHIW